MANNHQDNYAASVQGILAAAGIDPTGIHLILPWLAASAGNHNTQYSYTVHGFPTIADGVITLNGTDQAVSYDAFTLGADDGLSVASWVNATSWERVPVVAKDSETAQDFNMGTIPEGKMQAVFADVDGNYIGRRYGEGILADEGSYHCYATTYDGSKLTDGIRMYRDAAERSSLALSGGTFAGFTSGTSQVNVGLRRFVDPDIWLPASIGLTLIARNRVFTPTEIAAIYNLGRL